MPVTFLTAILVAAIQLGPIAVGDPAPALEAVSPEGQPVAGGWSGGQVAVVVFFATWCNPCHRALRELGAIRQAIGPRLRFVLIEAGDDPSDVQRFLVENPVPEGSVVALDPSGGIRQAWGCSSYPSLFIVDAKGIVRYINHGWGDGSKAKYLRRLRTVLADALPALPGAPVPPPAPAERAPQPAPHPPR